MAKKTKVKKAKGKCVIRIDCDFKKKKMGKELYWYKKK